MPCTTLYEDRWLGLCRHQILTAKSHADWGLVSFLLFHAQGIHVNKFAIGFGPALLKFQVIGRAASSVGNSACIRPSVGQLSA